jgi:ABC-2 type transport system ATP-binding protein
VLIARGEIVADGPATEIKANVGSRTVRATLPDVDVARLQALPGVLGADRHGDGITLSCSDTDVALGALFGSFPSVRDVEVHGASLEEAFFDLTRGEDGGVRDGMSEAPRSATEEESG